jgi:hypothetical protein
MVKDYQEIRMVLSMCPHFVLSRAFYLWQDLFISNISIRFDPRQRANSRIFRNCSSLGPEICCRYAFRPHVPGKNAHRNHKLLKAVSTWMHAKIYFNVWTGLSLKRQCQPQCICLHFTLKVMECQQITIINISLVLCRYNSVKMSKYNHRMVEIYDGLKTKTWITLPMLLFEHCLSAQCIVVDIVPLTCEYLSLASIDWLAQFDWLLNSG